MTDYSTIPRVNALYLESETLSTAIDIIDSRDGTVLSFVVGPYLAPPEEEPKAPLTPGRDVILPWPVPMLLETPAIGELSTPVTIHLPDRADTKLILDARAACVERQTQIAAELAALGVTNLGPDVSVESLGERKRG